jgi:hypothetical protein
MRLHPTNTQHATKALSRARGEVLSVHRMNCAVGELAKRKHNGKTYCATALNINTDSANARGSGGRIERKEVMSKVDRACGVNHPKLREITTGSDR